MELHTLLTAAPQNSCSIANISFHSSRCRVFILLEIVTKHTLNVREQLLVTQIINPVLNARECWNVMQRNYYGINYLCFIKWCRPCGLVALDLVWVLAFVVNSWQATTHRSQRASLFIVPMSAGVFLPLLWDWRLKLSSMWAWIWLWIENACQNYSKWNLHCFCSTTINSQETLEQSVT